MYSVNKLIYELNTKYNLEISINSDFYNMAFTHASYINENKNLAKNFHYERLEFLGDASLELSVSHHLFNNFKSLTEGELTKIRAAIVCEPTLVKYALSLEFDKYIKLGKGEEKIGGRKRPALLADIFESFIGALYLDKGIEKVIQFLEKTLFLEVSKDINNLFKDYKTQLQEYVNENKLGDISYSLVESTGPSHNKLFKSCVKINDVQLGLGRAKTKKESEQIAAKEALNIIQNSKEV